MGLNMNLSMKWAAGVGAMAVAALTGPALGQDLGVKAPPQGEPVVIQGATVHTVSGETIENGYVYFEKGVIRAVGKDPQPRYAEKPRVIDATGKHVYPGLIAPYSQLGLTEIQAVRA